MTRTIVLTTAVLLVLLAGCPHNRYAIEMIPAGGVMERKLTVTRVNGEGDPPQQVPDEEMRRLAKAYGRDTAVDNTLIGRFRAKTPDGVGGAGSYTHFATRMGAASIYVERFRGNDDLVGQLSEIHEAADKLTDLLIGWFASELRQDKRFKPLREFMDKGLRKDLKNLATHMWLEAIRNWGRKDGSQGMKNLAVRAGQYLIERGYFSPEDLPAFARIVAAHDGEDAAVRIAQRLVATKMGVPADQPVPDCLAFLSTSELAMQAFAGYIGTTDAFEARLGQWRKQREEEPDLPEPKPMDLPQELLTGLVKADFDISDSADELAVTLAVPREPIVTNGKWDPKPKRVAWSARIQARSETGNLPPEICYALWSEPDEEFQTRHFGKVVLDGKELLEYCLWRKGLTDKEGKEWDGFVAGLKPGESLKDKLGDFVFSHERGGQGEKGLARKALASIRKGLEEADGDKE